MQLHGKCHCGNLELEFTTSIPIDQLSVRADSCSFCSRHGARTTCDPQGRVRITIRDPGHLIRYRFGLKTADFLVCARCGIYLAAVLSARGASYATLNISTLDRASEFTQKIASASYEGETEQQRIARRVANWTPVASIAQRLA